MPIDVWSLILAAGAGRRLLPVTRGVPKQFWRPFGRTSLLEETLDRLAPLVPARRTVTIIDQSHRPYVNALPSSEGLGDVVFQPADRGTAAGVLLGLLVIAHRAPDAIVVVSPSDHAVQDPEAFREGLRTAIHTVRRSGRIVLVGIEPDRAREDYGWITASHRTEPFEVAGVSGFVEKPAASDAVRLFETGAVWSTMVLAARASALINLYRHWLPGLYAVLAPAAAMDRRQLTEYLDTVYATLKPYDFSRDLLTVGSNLSLLVLPSSTGWSDLGTPERLLAWQTATVASHLLAPSAA